MPQEEAQRIADRFRGFLPVVVDVETAGFNPRRDALLEIAAVLLDIDAQGYIHAVGNTYALVLDPVTGTTLGSTGFNITSQGVAIERATQTPVFVAASPHSEDGVFVGSSDFRVTRFIPDLSTGVAINEAGQVLINARSPAGRLEAYMWDAGSFERIEGFGGDTSGQEISENGEIVGSSRFLEEIRHAFYWTSGQALYLGTLGLPGSIAYDINDRGIIVGSTGEPPGQSVRGIIWTLR